MPIIPDNEDARARAREAVAAGGVIAFRTDTFYGLGADPFNPEALRAINELKGREGKPVLVVVSDGEEAERLLARGGRVFDALCARHWPGPLTLVAAARPEVPELITAGTGTVGVRLPDDAGVRGLVRACGGLLTATSANPSGLPPARDARTAANYFPHGLALVVDGGEARSELPSTVLDVSAAPPRLVREGALPREVLEETLKSVGALLV